MSDQPQHDIAEIEGLLASRMQLTGWMERLDSAGSTTPAAVRGKVRADYEARLAHVVDQLRAHADLISSTLDGLRAQSTEFRQARAEEQDVRAEAELRHTVGEYSDDEWQIVELRCSGKIAQLDGELGRLAGEITRLEEVQRLIAPKPVRHAPPPPPEPIAIHQEPSAAEELALSRGSEMPLMLDQDPLGAPGHPPLSIVRDEEPFTSGSEEPALPAARPEAPRFTPRGGVPPKGRDSGSARAIPFPTPAPAPAVQGDELAFLRSVSLDAAPPSARLTPHPAPNAAGMFDREERPSQLVAKTLKCGECGSLNKATEWYCERCGAELAAM